MTGPVLKVQSLRKEFGGLVAVKDVSFEVGEGEFVGLIGPNGCGKSTTFNCISGLLEQTSGKIEMFGEDIWREPAYGVILSHSSSHLSPCRTS